LDWKCYKQICDTPSVFSRWMLEQTHLLTESSFTPLLEPILQTAPILKPDDHLGNAATDMFTLTLTIEQVQAISNAIDDAVANERRTQATTRRGLGGFSEAWADYVRYLEKDQT